MDFTWTLTRLQEMGTYISDITRTWPVNGKFTDPQRDLYNAVLNVHRSCVSLCRESSNMSLDRLHTVAENGLKDQLNQLGFDLSGNVRSVPDPSSCSAHTDVFRLWGRSSLTTLDTMWDWTSTTALGIPEGTP